MELQLSPSGQRSDATDATSVRLSVSDKSFGKKRSIFKDDDVEAQIPARENSRAALGMLPQARNWPGGLVKRVSGLVKRARDGEESALPPEPNRSTGDSKGDGSERDIRGEIARFFEGLFILLPTILFLIAVPVGGFIQVNDTYLLASPIQAGSSANFGSLTACILVYEVFYQYIISLICSRAVADKFFSDFLDEQRKDDDAVLDFATLARESDRVLQMARQTQHGVQVAAWFKVGCSRRA